MKKLLTLATVAMFSVVASAQRATSSNTSLSGESKDVDMSVHFGIRAGLNVSNMRWTDGDYSDIADAKAGFHVGVIADVPLVKNYFYITPGLYFTQKGAENSESVDIYKWEEKLNPLYLEIPILFSGRYTFGKAQLQVNFGSYFAVGIAGKDKETITFYGVKETDKENIFKDGDNSENLKRFDAGLSMGAGVTLAKHYYVGLQYEMGLFSLYPSDRDGKVKNHNLMLSVGYNF